MDSDYLEKGIKARSLILGDDYVQKQMTNADSFTKPFQEAMTGWCWGFGWSDETIDLKTRSMLNLTMIAALGRMHEWELHCNAALNNDVSKDELRSIIHIISIYCGVPAGVECFRIAKKTLEARDEET